MMIHLLLSSFVGGLKVDINFATNCYYLYGLNRWGGSPGENHENDNILDKPQNTQSTFYHLQLIPKSGLMRKLS